MARKNQIEIALKLGIDVSGDSVRVAAARIEECVYDAINNSEKPKASIKQIVFARSLGLKIESDSRLIISAQITDELEKQNIEAINKFNLSAGDEVIIKQLGCERSYTISSIAQNYRLWFKGGNGRGAWPTQVITKIKKGEPGAAPARSCLRVK